HILANTVAREPYGAVAVRMFFSIDTEEARVESSLPYQGAVCVTLKQAGDLKLRRPEEVPESDLYVLLNGDAASVDREGAWLRLRDLAAGSVVEMRWPLHVTTRTEMVAG